MHKPYKVVAIQARFLKLDGSIVFGGAATSQDLLSAAHNVYRLPVFTVYLNVTIFSFSYRLVLDL